MDSLLFCPLFGGQVTEHLSRGAAEDAERGFVFPGVLDAVGESVKKSQISRLHHFGFAAIVSVVS
jgi:hypothetical protein